jgi:hypothetical protein
MKSTADRLRRATALWHAYLAITGGRFDLAQFLKDPVIEKQALDTALASGDQKLVGLAQDWLLGTGQAPKALNTRAMPGAVAAANGTPEAPKPARYLRGVR